MIDRRRAAGLLLIALAPTARLSAQSDPVAGARERLQRYLTEQHVPGASVAVSVGGRIVWSEAFGFAHLEHQVKATPATRFRVGSISKALTSIAVAKLWEAGRLDLDAPVQKYAPTFPAREQPITTRQLAGHLSGIPHYTRDDIVNKTRYESVTAALAKFQDRPLLFPPGTKYSYSSFGWNLISVVVEGASGGNFLEYMDREIFTPLGMASTTADDYDRIIEHRTGYYQVRPDGRPVNAPAVDNSDVWAGGGFLSTSEDLVRFADQVGTGKVLGPAATALLFTPMKTSDGKATGYGLGWRIDSIPGGARVVGHGGSHIGATADLVFLPDSRVAVAILTNSNNRGLATVSREIAAMFRPR